MKQERYGQPDLRDFLYQEIYPRLDRGEVLADLNPRDAGDHFTLTCPKCGEKEAWVYKDGHRIHCNRRNHCGETTTILDHVADAEGARGRDFIEALRKLAERAGISIPERELSPEELKRMQEAERRSRLFEAFQTYCQTQLRAQTAFPARRYLEERGFDEEVWERLGFGYYPSESDVKAALLAQDYTEAELIESGVLPPKEQRTPSLWNGRLTGPWRDRSGRISTFWARDISLTVSADKKYLYLRGARKRDLFGLDAARGHKELILVEGVFDVLSFHARGWTQVVGLGGASLADEQIKALTQAGIETLTLNLDHDPGGAGHRATLQAIDRLREAPFRLYVVDPVSMVVNGNLAAKVDADSYLKNQGLEAYRALVKGAMPATLYKAQAVLNAHDLTTRRGKDAALEELFRYDERLTDPRDRHDLWTLAEERTGYPAEDLLAKADTFHERFEKERQRAELAALIQEQQTALLTEAPERVMQALAQRIDSLRARTYSDEPEPFSVDGIMASIKCSDEGRISGWAPLDERNVRFCPAELSVLAARTGHGKTTALLSLALNWLDTYPDESFLIYSYEVPREALFIKLLSMLTRKQDGFGWNFQDVRDFLKGKMPPRGWNGAPKELEQAIATIRTFEKRLVVVYRTGWTADQILMHAQKEADRRGGIGGVLVDYLQIIPRPADMKADRRDIEVSLNARALKRLSVQLQCPVVTGAQLNRQSVAGSEKLPQGKFEDPAVQEAIGKRKPQLHQLREGGIEQEADMVLGLLNYRADFIDAYENADAGDRSKPGAFEITVLKNRFGELGTAKMILEGPTGYIRSPQPYER